jgi:hypothetical protein
MLHSTGVAAVLLGALGVWIGQSKHRAFNTRLDDHPSDSLRTLGA